MQEKQQQQQHLQAVEVQTGLGVVMNLHRQPLLLQMHLLLLPIKHVLLLGLSTQLLLCQLLDRPMMQLRNLQMLEVLTMLLLIVSMLIRPSTQHFFNSWRLLFRLTVFSEHIARIVTRSLTVSRSNKTLK